MNIQIPWGEILLWAHLLLVVTLMVRVLYRQRNIGVAVAWLVVLFVFPFGGVVAYLMVGEPRLGTARERRTQEMLNFYQDFSRRHLVQISQHQSFGLDERYHGISRVAAERTGLVPTEDNRMQLIENETAIIAAMRADIQQAQQSCLLAFYIIDAQGQIETLLEDVLAAAARGVHCHILADAVGSARFWRSHWPRRLAEGSVSLTKSLPVGLLKTFFVRADLRNHRKLMLIDKQIGYTGSFNLVDPQYFKQDAGVGQWVDVMMRCEGSVVQAMVAVFYMDVAVENGRSLKETQQQLENYGQQSLTLAEEPAQAVGEVVAQVIPSGPDQAEHVIYATIICALHAATRRIIITTPYFIPDDTLLYALITAAKRGVDVTLVVPQKIDSLLVRYASRAYYPMLLAAGVKIALFEGGLLHAKTMTIDTDYTLFGTVNMDMRSFYLNLEISLALYDQAMTREVVALQMDYLQQSTYIEPKAWQARSRWWGLVENTVRLFSPLL